MKRADSDSGAEESACMAEARMRLQELHVNGCRVSATCSRPTSPPRQDHSPDDLTAMQNSPSFGNETVSIRVHWGHNGDDLSNDTVAD